MTNPKKPNKITIKVYEIFEYTTTIDLSKIKVNPNEKSSKECSKELEFKKSETAEIKGQALLNIGRGEYTNKALIQTHIFKDNEKPLQIIINEKT